MWLKEVEMQASGIDGITFELFNASFSKAMVPSSCIVFRSLSRLPVAGLAEASK